MRALVERVQQGDVRAVARAMRAVDERVPGFEPLLGALWRVRRRAYTLGITGAPGAGKSTLVDKLASKFRAENKRVGILAIDPSSPFTGGAILGDRIRMQRHFLDEGVFIRSLSTRGAMGGLSRSTQDHILIMEAAGFDVVLVETVGVGQDELDIARVADSTLVVIAPGGGDDIQASKAGILEIADVFAVNKSDREGADAQVRFLESMIAFGQEVRAGRARATASHASYAADRTLGQSAPSDSEWIPPVLKTVAAKNEGIDLLYEHLEKHRAYVFSNKDAQKAKIRARFDLGFFEFLHEVTQRKLKDSLEKLSTEVDNGQLDRYEAYAMLLRELQS